MKKIILSDIFTDKPVIHQQRTQEELETSIPIHAEEIRQYLYCPRVIYFRRVANVHGVMTDLMEHGLIYHKQRKKSNYTRQGDIATYRDYYFFHEELQLGARVDLCREQEASLSIVEYKRYSHNHTFQSHIFQALAGGIAASFNLEKPLTTIEIQYYPGKSSVFEVTEDLIGSLIDIVVKMKTMILLQVVPPETENIKKCRVCEYQKICQMKP